ncbi:MAG: hypothetical protein Q7J80_16560 [Anaerolineales bacterium]|nr:hypothetical protein [Anaerolineales bacterium]
MVGINVSVSCGTADGAKVAVNVGVGSRVEVTGAQLDNSVMQTRRGKSFFIFSDLFDDEGHRHEHEIHEPTCEC